jgi:hypothetical protein
MRDGRSDMLERSRLRQMALSRWENEGGAGPDRPHSTVDSGDGPMDVPALTDAELVQLRIRVVALENLVIALLAQAPDGQLALADELAAYISPRPGFTPHRLTLHAADEMIRLVKRAARFRRVPPASPRPSTLV